jgi:hypothetical protein
MCATVAHDDVATDAAGYNGFGQSRYYTLRDHTGAGICGLMQAKVWHGDIAANMERPPHVNETGVRF